MPSDEIRPGENYAFFFGAKFVQWRDVFSAHMK
jgi:hypothetical protein